MWPIRSAVDEERQYFSTLAAMCKEKKGKKFFIWGAGTRGTLMGYSLERAGITHFSYIDSDTVKQRNKLNGKSIFSPKVLRESHDNFVIISIENNIEIVDYLRQINYRKDIDYIVVESIMDDTYMESLNSVQGCKPLVLGGSILNNVELDDKGNCLARMIEEVCSVQVLAMNVLPTSIAYFVVKNLCCRDRIPNELTVFLSCEMFTDYNHLLPRTQKLSLVKQLLDTGYDREELEAYYKVARERAKDYALERMYAPYRDGDEAKEIMESSVRYAERVFSDGFNPENESFMYFRKLVELMKSYDIRGNFVWEPVNYQQYEKTLGERYINSVALLLQEINEIVETHMRVFKYNNLLESKYFVSFHTMSEAVKADGREIIVRELCRILKQDK